MDRGWISKAKTSIEYRAGVYQFLQFAFRGRTSQEKKILCPCINCANCLMKSYTEVKEHLWCDGFLKAYTRWTCHGEEPLPPSASYSIHNNSQFNEDNNLSDAEPSRVDNMQGLVHAALGVHDEPSMPNLVADEIRSIDEIVNEAYEQSTEDQVEDVTLRKLLKDANTELYPGCTTYSKLSFIIRLYQNKCMYGWSKESFDAQLKLFADTIPDASNVPTNYQQAKKIIKSLGLDYIKIHACPNDCMLFYGDRKNQEICHICKTSRWQTPKKESAADDCVLGKEEGCQGVPLLPSNSKASKNVCNREIFKKYEVAC